MPKLNEGTFATAWTLQHAVNVNPGGIKDPIEMAILETTKSGVVARMLDDSDTAEHCNNVNGLEDYIGKYPVLSGEGTASVPEVHKPPQPGG